jgi:hypothetical protein
MRDPDRLLDDDRDRLRTALMRSALGDGPKEGSRSRVAKALGISASAGAATLTTTSASAGAAAKTGASMVTWVGLTTVAVTAGLVGTFLALRRPESAVPPSAPATPASAVVAATPTALGPATSDPPTIDVSSLPRAPSAAVRAASNGTARAPRNDPSTLAAELSALDEARASLSAGDPGGTLAKLDAYEHRFPGGHLRDETMVLRIEALIAQGNPAAAQTLGQRFLAASPASPYAARVRRLLGAPGTDPTQSARP